MSNEQLLREALKYIADQIEAYSDAEHRNDIAHFARDMAGAGRPGFKSFIESKYAATAS